MAPKASRGGGEAALEVLIPRLGRPQLEALLLSYESVLPKGRLKKGAPCHSPFARALDLSDTADLFVAGAALPAPRCAGVAVARYGASRCLVAVHAIRDTDSVRSTRRTPTSSSSVRLRAHRSS